MPGCAQLSHDLVGREPPIAARRGIEDGPPRQRASHTALLKLVGNHRLDHAVNCTRIGE